MTGERAFIKFQYGKETTRGDSVAASGMMLADPMPINPDRKPRFIEDALGVRAASMRTAIDQFLMADSLKFSNGYFQILPALLGCGVKGGITPTEVTGGQADYKWQFFPSLTGSNAPDSLTLELGDDTQEYEAEYCMFDKIKISGAIAQEAGDSAVAIEAGFFGRQLAESTFTGALALPTVEPLNAKLCRFYLDPSWAALGTTEKTGLLRAFDVEILTGLHPKFHGGANKYFDVHAEGLFAIMASFTFEGNSDANAIWTARKNQTLAVARLSISGAQIGTGTNHNLKLDIGGKWDDVKAISSIENGNNLHTATLHGLYDPTGAKLFQAEVTTNKLAY